MVDWLSDPKNVQYSEQRHRKHNMATQQAYVRTFDHINNHFWLIRKGTTDIGTITAHRDPINGIGEIGILIDHHYWGKGYGRQAWSAVMDYLLQNMRKVETGTRADNAGMRKVMENCGMVFEGERISHFMDGDETFDLVMYGRLK
jgi:RimJ/RimL family protein N-acetyltransferase